MTTEMKDRVTKLLVDYHDRERKIALLEYELANPARVTEAEMIGAMTYARPEESGRPAGHISNKTLYIALNYQDRAEEINVDSFKEIHAELTKLKEEQDRLNYYISLLEPRPMRVLKRTYIERASNEDVAKELGISVRRLQEVKNQAIESLAEMYEYTESLH